MKYIVYLITNLVNGKEYVGVTSKANITRRLREHISASQKTKKKGMRILSAIRKYGKDMFVIEELCSSNNREHAFNILEPYFIKLRNTQNTGYNCSSGGEGQSYCSEEKRRKLRKSWEIRKLNGYISPLKGKKRSVEDCLAISNAKKGKPGRIKSEHECKQISNRTRGSNNPFFGKKHTTETRQKMSLSVKAGLNKPEIKLRMASTWKIITPTGETLIINNLKQFCKTHKLNPGNLRETEFGKRKHCGGYKCQQLVPGFSSHKR